MKLFDLLIITFLLLWVVFAIRSLWRQKRSGGCMGCRDGCRQCRKNSNKKRPR